jgi:hypothetical protein
VAHVSKNPYLIVLSLLCLLSPFYFAFPFLGEHMGCCCCCCSLPELGPTVFAKAVEQEPEPQSQTEPRVDGDAQRVEDPFLVHPRCDQTVCKK